MAYILNGFEDQIQTFREGLGEVQWILSICWGRKRATYEQCAYLGRQNKKRTKTRELLVYEVVTFEYCWRKHEERVKEIDSKFYV